ncbi:hypothetical protein TRICI_003660 [Trichomonascus ciferrii]|uniref:Glycogen debranching enzyme C-terminal domain-containing protein n=1 Tax=Trichomonascus ciferrii TaxID=44093 RepID=A0A642V2L9_9ASCO|nr:hypothetical protein TRICI_003660 [Trichomonascus ciferrii]
MKNLVIWLASFLSFGTCLKLNVDRAGFKNYLVKEGDAAAQVLVPDNSGGIQRFLAAFPAGNSGLLMYLQSESNDFSMRIVDDNVRTLDSDRANSGYTAIKGTLDLSQDSKMGVTILGGVRGIREYEEAGRWHTEFNFTVAENKDGKLKLNRKWINSEHNMNITLTSAKEGGASIKVNGKPDKSRPLDCNFGKGKLDFLIELNEESIEQTYGVGDLFVSGGEDTGTRADVLNSINDNKPAQELSFLAYKNKFLVGGWRYLSYYGRDDLFAIMMLLPVLKREAVETVFASVFERMYLNGVNTDSGQSQEGEVCNQETLGDYAGWINSRIGRSDDAHVFSYGMKDTNFLLLPAIANYFLETDEGKGREGDFLQKKRQRPNGGGEISYRELLEKNIQLVLDQTKSFADNPSPQNLVQFSSNYPSGNWRDTRYGNVYGNAAFDINVVYAPAALRAIADLADKNIVDQKFKNSATQYASVWEDKAIGHFKVSGSKDSQMNNVHQYTRWANLDDGLVYSQGAFNDSKPFDSDAKTEGWLNNDDDSHTYYGLSLKQGSPVGVLHSDIGLGLLYGHNKSEEYMKCVADALLPFPLGLTTPVGMVVANPALSSDQSLYSMFSNSQYHGSTIWGWQIAAMANGLAKQLASCDISSVPSTHAKLPDKPSWCDNSKLVSSLIAGLDRLWQGVEGAKDEIYTEVWSYAYTGSNSANSASGKTDIQSNNFAVSIVGELLSRGQEGNPIQLWSYGILAAKNPRN